MIRVWTTPAGEYNTLYADMLNQVHLLIAGCTGSGKSTVVNGIMETALLQAPSSIQFVLIDPKGTELAEYSTLPHVLQYAQETKECVQALKNTLELTKQRFDAMKRAGARMFDGSDVYVVIDELMFLLNRPQYKRIAMDVLQDILVIARAARVHVIACTQSPTKDTGLPVNLRCNFDSRLGLRTTTAQDSRNILGIAGLEKFPVPQIEHIAKGIYMHSGIMECYNLPKDSPENRARLIKWWKRHKKPKLRILA